MSLKNIIIVIKVSFEKPYARGICSIFSRSMKSNVFEKSLKNFCILIYVPTNIHATYDHTILYRYSHPHTHYTYIYAPPIHTNTHIEMLTATYIYIIVRRYVHLRIELTLSKFYYNVLRKFDFIKFFGKNQVKTIFSDEKNGRIILFILKMITKMYFHLRRGLSRNYI